MINEVRISHFKRFEADEVIDVSGDVVLLAGPNNSGKSTVLQALAAWNLGMQRWLAERGERPSQKRISLTVDEFTAAPVREMNLLWRNRRTADARRTETGKPTTKARPIIITVSGSDAQGATWTLAIELLYANQKLVYARPVNPDRPDDAPVIPPQAKQAQIVHIPPFSGLETEEPFRAAGYRDRLIGQGRPGEIVRNLLWEIWQQRDQAAWKALVKDIEDLFGYTLLPPVYNATKQAFIICEYRPRSTVGAPVARLDIASAGSGFHQVLLLLAFFYAKPATVLLLDEPDAHLHFILQREVFNRLRAVAAERRCQLIVATHAEALLDDTEPTGILSFFKKPHRLQTRKQVQDLRAALHRLSSTDLLQADHVGAVLYLEDDSDARLLGEWAGLLHHPAERFFKFPYIYALGGAGELSEAKRHFLALNVAFPGIHGLCLLDRDRGAGPEAQDFPGGLRLLRWNRYEIENYLLNPLLIKRFLAQNYLVAPADPDQPALPMVAPETIEQDQATVDQEFARQGLAGLDPLSDDIQILRDLKASELVVSILGKTARRLPKRDLYLIARVMRPDEVHPEIIAKLDQIAAMLPPEMADQPAENHADDPSDGEET